MGPKEAIQQNTCPSCGAGPRVRCFNVSTGEVIDDVKHHRFHQCHIARYQLYQKRGRPIQHDDWPITALRT